jgi:hypothetical protein
VGRESNSTGRPMAQASVRLANAKDLPQFATPQLTEDEVLALLSRPDITAETLAVVGRERDAMTSRKVALALVIHPRTPRHISIPALTHMFTFDLMQVALTPTVAGDIRRAAEEQILHRLEALSTGEKISLARRASGRVAEALLQDQDPLVLTAALDNPRLIENSVVTALMKAEAAESLFVKVSEHLKWSVRREVQIALLRSDNLPLPRAVELAWNFSADFLREIAPESRLSTLVQPSGPLTTADPKSGDKK